MSGAAWYSLNHEVTSISRQPLHSLSQGDLCTNVALLLKYTPDCASEDCPKAEDKAPHTRSVSTNSSKTGDFKASMTKPDYLLYTNKKKNFGFSFSEELWLKPQIPTLVETNFLPCPSEGYEHHLADLLGNPSQSTSFLSKLHDHCRVMQFKMRIDLQSLLLYCMCWPSSIVQHVSSPRAALEFISELVTMT